MCSGKDSVVDDRPTDADLIAASLTDTARFALIFDRHYDAIHRYLARRLGGGWAEDLTATVFLKAFESRRRFRPSASSAVPWLYGIASNVLRRHARTELRRLRAFGRLARGEPVELDTGAIADRADAASAAPKVYLALAALPEAERTTLLLVAWTDLTYEQVAVALDIPVGTVRSRLHRARGRLRELLSASGQERDVHAIRASETPNDG
jgi:RNA polymerase sigma-70 factor (ECF subfamily)